VRLIFRAMACLILVLGLAMAPGKPAAAQPGQDLFPEQSAAKAKAILQQVIAALGGSAYLNVRDSDCEGRLAQYGHSGEVANFTLFHDQWLLPDKNRAEYITKGMNTILGSLIGIEGGVFIMHGGVLVTVYTADQGWMLDKSGVSDQPEDVVKNFAEQVKSGMNIMLRSRMNEDGVEFRYAGPDLADLKEVEWIEFSDRDHRALRLAVEKSTHLPVRWVVERTEITTSYAQFTTIDGVKTPFRVARAQNGRPLSQTYVASCKYNANLSTQLFTRVSLEQRAPEVNKKGDKDSKGKK
jgi:hypothetical protein